MDFRSVGGGGGGGGGGGKKRGGGGSQKSANSTQRYNVTPNSNATADQVNQLLLQQYFLQQETERSGGNSMAAAQAAAAAALFGGILNDKLMGGGGGGGGGGMAGNNAREQQQQLQELFAAAAAAQQPPTSSHQQQSQSSSRNSSTPSPSPRISSPLTSRASTQSTQSAAAAAALQQLTAAAAAAALTNSGSKKDANAAAAAIAAQQQWMYLDYLNRIQEQAQQQAQQAQQAQQQQAQQQQQHSKQSQQRNQQSQQQQRGGNRGNVQQRMQQKRSGGSGGGGGGGGRQKDPQQWATPPSRNASASDLSRLFEQYASPPNNQSLLKSSVLVSAKLPADTEIIVQRNSRGNVLPPLKQAPGTHQPGKRGPKPKNLVPQPPSSTVTSEQAKFEQQLINLGNNNAITITPAGMDLKTTQSTTSSSTSSSGGGQAPPPITITPANDPPAAHSTPFRYGNDKRETKVEEGAVPKEAHQYVKDLYTHVIPRRPQIGLIGPSRKQSSNKKQQNQHQPKAFTHHRPWMNEQSNVDLVITPSSTSTPPPLNLNMGKGKSSFLNIPKPAPEPIIISPPDYSVPITQGWRREMILKSFDLNEENMGLACDITYISPEGKVFSSLNEIKKASIPDPKNYTFNSKIQLGKFVLPGSENCTKRFEYDELVEYFNERKRVEAVRKRELRMKHEHNNYIKLIEAFRKNKRKMKLSEKKRVDEAAPKSNEVDELIDDIANILPEIGAIEGKRLNDKTFANMLQIHEFLHTFGETLGFDSESLPSLSSLQKAFLHVEDNEEELVSVLSHLLVCAVEDPGLPNPTGTKHLTPFGQTLKQADVTFGSMSEILRIYLNGISDSEPEAEEYAEWLELAPFTAQSAFRKSTIVAFVCDVLLQNKAVLKYLENCSELIHNCKKEKQQNEIRVRKLRMLVARKQVAASIEEEEGTGGGSNSAVVVVGEKVSGGGGGGDDTLQSAGEDSVLQGEDECASLSIIKKESGGGATNAVASVADAMTSDPDSKLSIEELNSKMAALGTSNEKLKKQMQNNSKCIRSVCIGQDRWRRRFWNLHYGGGIYVEGGGTGEFDELRDIVKEKLDKMVDEVEDVVVAVVPPPAENNKMVVVDEKPVVEVEKVVPEVVEEEKKIVEEDGGVVIKVEEGVIKDEKDGVVAKVVVEEKRSTPFTVPPPVIKIFSFKPRTACSGRNQDENEENAKMTDDELLVKHVKKSVWWEWRCLKGQADVDTLSAKLCEKGIREKNLKNALGNCNFKRLPDFCADEIEALPTNPEDTGFVDPELLYKIHLGLIETLETLEERVASASLQIKGWVLPQRNLIQENLSEEQIIEIVKERVLELEGAVERRYLKPPLGKSGLEVNLTQLLKESEDVSYNLLLDGPIGSTSSTRGQQINENNKLKMELKERERIEKELAMRKEKEEGGGGKGESRFLTHWRDSIGRTTSPSVLSMAIYILDSCIAWDKSVMKASCQLCKGGDNEDKLLLCDACDRGYHTYCFKPPLDNIPDGDWFCWECINKATGNKCCIVCGKGQIPNIKLLCCDKCVKAYHQDCIIPNVAKAPRGRWFCPDHRENCEGRGKVTLSQAVSVSMNSSGNASDSGERGGGPTGGTTPVKKVASPKKKRGSEKQREVVDGNVSDSSNSSSFVGGNNNCVVPASQESSDGGGSEKRPATPVVAAAPPPTAVAVAVVAPTTPTTTSKKESKKKTSEKGKRESEKKEVEKQQAEKDVVSSGGEEKEPKPAKMSKKLKSEMGWCERILDELVTHDEAWPFLEPVNTRQFPTYKKIIKTPMDLQTIRTRLDAGQYKGKEAFLQDVRLIFDNCEIFNEDDSPVGKAGHCLRVFFESKPGIGPGAGSGGSGGSASSSGK